MCVVSVLGIFATAPAAGEERDIKGAAEHPIFQGVCVRVEERAHDGAFAIFPSDYFRKIDAHAVLRINLEPVAPATRTAPSEAWLALNTVIEEIASLQQEYLRLTQEANLLLQAPERADKEFRAAVQAYDRRFNEMLRRLTAPSVAPILSREQLNAIMAAGAEPGQDPWKLLIQHLEAQRKRLYQEAERHAAKPDHFVVVRAYQVPQDGETRRLHVDGYDNLPSRPVAPETANRPIPTGRELAELQASLAGAELVADSINEVLNNSDAIGSRLRTFMRDADARIKQLLAEYETAGKRFQGAKFNELLAELRRLDTTDAKRLAENLPVLQRDVQQLGARLAAIADRIDPVRERAASVALQDLLGLYGVLTAIGDDLRAVSEQLTKVEKTLQAIRNDLQTVLAQAQQQANAKLRDDLKSLEDDLTALAQGTADDVLAGLPKTREVIDALALVVARFSAHKEVQIAAASLSSAEPGVIAQPLNKLQEGILDLRRANVAFGDRIEMRIAFVRAANGHPDFSQVEKELTYAGEVTATGWHRRFSGDLIFAKAVRGPGSDTFQPNVAVSLEWHYYDRDRPNGFLNWLDPGVGVHAANLDQDNNQAVELGAGVNVSLWGGLLRVGYGTNFGVQHDRAYWWVGFGLFGALNQLNAPAPTRFSGSSPAPR